MLPSWQDTVIANMTSLQLRMPTLGLYTPTLGLYTPTCQQPMMEQAQGAPALPVE